MSLGLDAKELAESECAQRRELLSRFRHAVLGSPMALVVAVRGNSCTIPMLDGGGGFLDGPDGEALSKTLDSMGYPKGSLMGVQLPDDLGAPSSKMTTADLRLIIEVVDPIAVAALDRRALEALTEAFDGKVEERVVAGDVTGRVSRHVLGRLLVFVDDLEASLGSQDGKRRAWLELRNLSGPIGRS